MGDGRVVGLAFVCKAWMGFAGDELKSRKRTGDASHKTVIENPRPNELALRFFAFDRRQSCLLSGSQSFFALTEIGLVKIGEDQMHRFILRC